MIVHEGHRLWTTEELAASLIVRGLMSGNGVQASRRRAARRWAADHQVRPVATTRKGGYLWPEDALAYVLDMEPCPT